MKYIPVLHRIIVKPNKFKQHNKDRQRLEAAGLVIPDMEDDAKQQARVDEGVVVAVGPTAFKDYGVESPVKIGDIVNYANWSGKYLGDASSEDLLIVLNDEDIVCVIKD
jgi:co-chaperonin GroES (HSP10)